MRSTKDVKNYICCDANIIYCKWISFFFYSNESNEPAHLHVTKGNASEKVWLEPEIDVAYFKGFTNSEERFI